MPAGPAVRVAPETPAAVQGAILAGRCIEFDYARADGGAPKWRRVVPYGLVHGAVTYLVGKMPAHDEMPVFYRLDRMQDARIGETPGCAPDDWDLDAWLAESFGIWRDGGHDVVLRMLPDGVRRARDWRFHPTQTIEDGKDGTLLVRFRAGGLRELAEHCFTCSGEMVIEGPEPLKAVLQEWLQRGATMLERPLLSCKSGNPIE